MKSIWIGVHAIEQFAARVERQDVASLTKLDRERIRLALLDLYRNSVLLDDSDRRYRRSKTRPGEQQRLCHYEYNARRLPVVLICAPDNTHNSGALKLVTVIKVKESK